MIEQTDIGKTRLKKRNVQRIWFLVAAGFPGVLIGGYLVFAQAKHPETSLLQKFEIVPIGLVILLALYLMGLLIYNWSRFDEFERPRYDRSSSFALFASVIILPWYVAGAQGLMPPPHPLACFFLFFLAKAVTHTAQKLLR